MLLRLIITTKEELKLKYDGTQTTCSELLPKFLYSTFWHSMDSKNQIRTGRKCFHWHVALSKVGLRLILLNITKKCKCEKKTINCICMVQLIDYLCHNIWHQIGDMSPNKIVENGILSDLKCGISQHAANNRKCENQNWGTEGNDRKIGSDIMLQVEHISVLNRVSFMISLPNIKGGG